MKTLDNFTLKIIAAVTMIIDHIGALLFPEIGFLRFIGRTSFPIFAFLIVQGFIHTSKNKQRFLKYIIRIGIFAGITELTCFLIRPVKYLIGTNVLITFFIALIGLYLLEKYKNFETRIVVIIGAELLAILSQCQYCFAGIPFMFMLYFSIKNKKKYLVLLSFLFFMLSELGLGLNWHGFGVIFAFIFVSMYNGKVGINNKFVKYFFYAFYPLQFLILGLIQKNYF